MTNEESKEISLQALSFLFIVTAFGTGGFSYLLHICDGIELAFLAVCLVIAVVIMCASGSELVWRLWHKKDKV
jgi:hypothetical protein